jgi:heme/copper-type cytochrome/quinol oxidase subunit 2
MYFMLVVLLLSANSVFAQTEMADTLRSNGKIYVVVMVIATIFAGLFGYLIYLDRKISKSEKSKK